MIHQERKEHEMIVPKSFRLIAHRGASLYMPENTIAAIEKAIDIGATEVEIDVQLTRDNKIVLCHDLSLCRYGHPGIKVQSEHYHQLKDLDMSSWFNSDFRPIQRMPLLANLLENYLDKLTFHIELRHDSQDLCQSVVELIRDCDPDKFIITSAFYSNLTCLRFLNQSLALAWLVEKIDDSIIEKAANISLFQICPKVENLTQDSARKALKTVPEIRGRGCSGSRDTVFAMINKLLDCGAHGATIDAPDWFLKT